MKKIITTCFACLFLFTGTHLANAHTTIEHSNPRDGEVVTTAMDEITLTFGNTLQPLSTITLTKDGKEVQTDVHVKEKQLIVSPKETLSNGKYQVEWRIAAADGHGMSGKYSFILDVKEAGQATKEEKAEEDDKKELMLTSVAVLCILALLITFFMKRKR